MNETQEDTKYAMINCDECVELSKGQDTGNKYLSKSEYDRQMANPNKGWQCPVCKTYPCTFDDDYFEQRNME